MSLAAADFSQIPMSQNLAATLARASETAGASGATEVALEHVLFALCDDPDAEAVLTASRVDVMRLRSETAGYLGTLPRQQPGAVLAVSQGLSRILEAAAAAARGGRRRDINGAIVLAAIVGDGKSVAAQILQVMGLTFDEAIRALQSALMAPAREALPDIRPADDVLARARERVQSRAAPGLRDMMYDRPRAAPPPPAPPPTFNSPEVAEPTLQPEPRLSYPIENPVSLSAQDFEPELPTPQLASPADNSNPPAILLEQNEDLDALREPKFDAPTDQSRFEAPPALSLAPGYVYPEMRSAPVAMSPPSAPFPLDFSRPTPIATPPPIPQQAFPPSAYPPSPFPQGSMPPTPPGYGGSPNFGAPAEFDGFARAPQPPSGQRGAPAPIGMPSPVAGSAASQPMRGARPKADTGQLAENIPRAMRVGTSERVEVRIGKAAAKAITEGLEGGGVAWRHEVTVTQAMSVRLRAPDGGFFIETVSPETQWIENHLGFESDDFASWRFLVTPQTRGWARLQIVVSARTIGGDGMAAETALPDQLVDVKVRTNYKRTFARWTGWVLAAVAGGALAKFGEGGLAIANTIVEKLMK